MPTETPAGPRVGPASGSELGLVNGALVRVAQRVAKTTAPPNLFTTMGRHRGLFRRWLFFAGKLMPGGNLPRRDTELVILRVSHRTGCPYEAGHHRPMALKAGLSREQIEALEVDAIDEDLWSARQVALIRAVDELNADRRIGDETFGALRSQLSDRDLVELCMLEGHYEMLAGLINSLGIQVDEHR